MGYGPVRKEEELAFPAESSEVLRLPLAWGIEVKEGGFVFDCVFFV